MQTLFDLPQSWHRDDPHTSRLAAEDNATRRHSQARDVAAAVRRHPGSTSAELARATGMDRHLCGRRCPDAARLGLVRQGPARACNVSGRQAVTWLPVEDSHV